MPVSGAVIVIVGALDTDSHFALAVPAVALTVVVWVVVNRRPRNTIGSESAVVELSVPAVAVKRTDTPGNGLLRGP